LLLCEILAANGLVWEKSDGTENKCREVKENGDKPDTFHFLVTR
jgi:hypothetical protein